MVSQSGVLDVGISDHQLIFCTRKKQKLKLNQHKTIKTRNFKNYTADKYCDHLKEAAFPNYSDFDDVYKAFSNFSEKILNVVDGIAPYREFRVKGKSEDWFDGKIMERIKNCDKLLAKYKKSKLQVDHEIYREAKIKTSQVIMSKKVSYFKQKIVENTGNSKKIWKTLNSLGLPSKKGSESNICLKKGGEIHFDPKINAGIFKDFYSNLARDLVKELPSGKSKYNMDYVKEYYDDTICSNGSFNFSSVGEKQF